MTHILICDDNTNIRKLMGDYLLKKNYTISYASDGNEALNCFESETFDMVLLDVMMPGLNGFEVCQAIRKTSQVPIIMITARGEDHDRILGLDIGADDYIVKPFVLEEVDARIKAILRRIEPKDSHNTVIFGSLRICLDNYTASIRESYLSLTKKEFDILWTLAKHMNQVFSRDQLLDTIWGFDYFGDARTVDAHIKRLRAKLECLNVTDWHISTVWGVGYKFEALTHEA